MERVYNELNKVLKDEFLTRIHQNTPDFFEKLIIELMEKMEYGRGEVTQRSRLIDGQKLAQLMIEYDFGVSTEYVYKVKKIDTDLFEDDA